MVLYRVCLNLRMALEIRVSYELVGARLLLDLLSLGLMCGLRICLERLEGPFVRGDIFDIDVLSVKYHRCIIVEATRCYRQEIVVGICREGSPISRIASPLGIVQSKSVNGIRREGSLDCRIWQRGRRCSVRRSRKTRRHGRGGVLTGREVHNLTRRDRIFISMRSFLSLRCSTLALTLTMSLAMALALALALYLTLSLTKSLT